MTVPPGARILRLSNIHKHFGGAPVLTSVSFDVAAGEVHALVGENGAGKSTLMNIITGIVQPDSGVIEFEGREVTVANPRQARDLGIGFVHQELALVPQLTVSENIFLGRHPRLSAGLPIVNWEELRARARQVLETMGCGLDPDARVEELSIGEQQLVEIARGIAFLTRLIILDEPTAALSGPESERLFRVVRELKSRGAGVVYITHRLAEVYALADRVTVLRDGRRIATAPISETSPNELVRQMVGRELSEDSGAMGAPTAPEVALRIDGFTCSGAFRNISLEVRAGEIVALAGIIGAGRTELLESIFGVTPPDRGRTFVFGTERAIRTPADAIRHGIALVPDDRKAKGLVPHASVLVNMVLASKRRFVIDSRDERESAKRVMDDLDVRGAGLDAWVDGLSGGNQQKIVLAKWLLTEVRVLLLDEPTRGVDVAAKAGIYAIVRALAARGVAVLFASSDMDEVLRLAHRIVVFRAGAVADELSREEATDERILSLAIGVQPV